MHNWSFQLDLKGKKYQADLSHQLDISIPVGPRGRHPIAFHAPYIEFEPVQMGGFIGSTLSGSAVNFKNVRINPHGNGTHTECVGHITTSGETVSETLSGHHFIAELISVYPTKLENGDLQIQKFHLEQLGISEGIDAVIFRTLPNSQDKLERNWSGSNPPYFAQDAIEYLVELGIQHLLIDLPSVDKEEDEGALSAHKSWWQTNNTLRTSASITEMVFVPDHIFDGLFLLNLQYLNWELDASPSRPILYPLKKI